MRERESLCCEDKICLAALGGKYYWNHVACNNHNHIQEFTRIPGISHTIFQLFDAQFKARHLLAFINCLTKVSPTSPWVCVRVCGWYWLSPYLLVMSHLITHHPPPPVLPPTSIYCFLLLLYSVSGFCWRVVIRYLTQAFLSCKWKDSIIIGSQKLLQYGVSGVKV